MPRALVALGSNLGDRAQTLERAVGQIVRDASQQPAVSQLHETPPVGGPAGQDAFLNAAMAFETDLEPTALHAVLKRVELDLGRVRGERWGARAIDLDLLLYDDAHGQGQIVESHELQVPHPRMSFRRFVLEPAVEVAPEMIHPVIGWSVEQLMDHLNHAAPHVMIVGLAESLPAELSQAAATGLGTGYSAEPGASEGVAMGSDPSGRALPRPIQFLDRVASVLADSRRPPGETVISAFSVEGAFGVESGFSVDRVSADQQSPPSPLAAQIRPREPLPLKLLILLDDWEMLLAAQSNLANVPADARRRELLRLAVHDYQGPVLCAGRTGFAAQLNEITAALVAMR